jgi:hypothetical protein
MNRREFAALCAAAVGCLAAPGLAAESAFPLRHILCMLGPKDWLPIAERCVSAFGHDFVLDHVYSLEHADDRMVASFEVSHDRVAPTYLEDDRRGVRAHRSVAYVLSPLLERESSLDVSAQALKLVAALFAHGGLACKSERTGNAHGKKRWISLATSLDSASAQERNALLYHAWVHRPLSDDGILYSVGMHVLGLPDIEYSGDLDELTATAMIDKVAFRMLDGDGARFRRIDRDRYAADEIHFNPYGYVRVDDADLRRIFQP